MNEKLRRLIDLSIENQHKMTIDSNHAMNDVNEPELHYMDCQIKTDDYRLVWTCCNGPTEIYGPSCTIDELTTQEGYLIFDSALRKYMTILESFIDNFDIDIQ